MIELIENYLMARKLTKELKKSEMNEAYHCFQKAIELVNGSYSRPKTIYREIPQGIRQENYNR